MHISDFSLNSTIYKTQTKTVFSAFHQQRKMASTISLYYFIPLVFVVWSATSFADVAASNFQFPAMQAEKLIKSLNLFPKHGANIRARGESDLATSPIVEKPVRFPFLADSEPSVADLGHHAGYYRLPHTNDARCLFSLFFVTDCLLRTQFPHRL